MKCPKCRHEKEEGAKFCEECAAPLGRACAKCGRLDAPHRSGHLGRANRPPGPRGQAAAPGGCRHRQGRAHPDAAAISTAAKVNRSSKIFINEPPSGIAIRTAAIVKMYNRFSIRRHGAPILLRVGTHEELVARHCAITVIIARLSKSKNGNATLAPIRSSDRASW
jgi:hypothetical protein